MQPLTHHEILQLLPPFTERGRQVDLAASDRATRQLVFKPVLHPLPGEGDIEDTLRLEPFGNTQFRLTRQLTHPGGLQASLRAVGASPAELLAGIEAVAPQSQFRHGDGYAIALNQRLAAGAGGAQAQVVLLDGVARIGALTLTFTVPSVPGVPADVNLAAGADPRPDLPQDLLAVLGWDWARLIAQRHGWHSRAKLARKEPRRSLDAVAKLERATVHIARTLAEPPPRFHERFLSARWGVVFRRGIPVLTLVLLALGLWVLSRYAVGRETGAWVLLIHVPTLMLAISFRMQELAQFEIPPLPRRLPATNWGGPGS